MCFNDRLWNVTESIERKPENKPLQNLTLQMSGLSDSAKWYQVAVTWMLKKNLHCKQLTYFFWAVDCSSSVISPSTSYKWWIIGVFMFHSCAVVIATVIQNRDEVGCNSSYVLSTILFMGIHCLRDDFVELSIGVQVGGLTITGVFMFHSCALVIATVIQNRDKVIPQMFSLCYCLWEFSV